jgi:hypothetical protein
MDRKGIFAAKNKALQAGRCNTCQYLFYKKLSLDMLTPLLYTPQARGNQSDPKLTKADSFCIFFGGL